jgi:hypothetical protein
MTTKKVSALIGPPYEDSVICVAAYAGHGVSFAKVLRVRAWLSSAVSRDVFRYDLHARESLFLNVHKIRVDSDNKW